MGFAKNAHNLGTPKSGTGDRAVLGGYWAVGKARVAGSLQLSGAVTRRVALVTRWCSVVSVVIP